ncbi:MAG TPA: neutral zinc metallopeptidase [Micromonosporaceae bacterium]
MIWKSAAAAGAAALALLTAGCLIPGGGGAGAGNPDDGVQATPERRTAPTASATGESLEGQFSYQTMDEYVDAVVPMITQWLEATWRSMPDTRGVIYIRHGRAVTSDCVEPDGGQAVFTASAYAYCGADEKIYVGQDMLWTFYTRSGDAGPAVGLAHEWGHHIQQQVGVPGARTAEQSVLLENQADCIAGAWTRYTDQQGWLEYPDDIEDIEALFPLIGSAEGPGRDHGTTSERARAFQRGFDGSVSACSGYFPATPLIS